MKKFLLGLLLSLFVVFPVTADQTADFGKYKSFYQFLSINGNGTGTIDMSVVGTLTAPQVFKVQPAAGEVILVHRIILHIEDNSTFAAEGYGSISTSPLTNGILVQHRRTSDDSVIEDFNSGEPIVSNANWTRLAYDLTYHDFGIGSTNKFLTSRFTFAKSGQPLSLNANTYLAVVIQDDLSTIVDHTIMAQGFYLK